MVGRPGTFDARWWTRSITCYATTPRGALPHDLPPWQTVNGYFRAWRLDDTWETFNTTLRARVRAGRQATPSAAILDSERAKTTEQGAAR